MDRIQIQHRMSLSLSVEKPLFLRKRVLLPSIGMLLGLCFLVLVRSDSVTARSRDLASLSQKDKARISVYIKRHNPAISQKEHDALLAVIEKEAVNLQIPSNIRIDNRPIRRAFLITALIRVESDFVRGAISRANARGYMQLMLPTVSWMDQQFGKKTTLTQLHQANINIAHGVSYMNLMLREFKDVRLACLAYNAGPGNVRRGFWVERYWEKVLNSYRDLHAVPVPESPSFASALGRGVGLL